MLDAINFSIKYEVKSIISWDESIEEHKSQQNLVVLESQLPHHTLMLPGISSANLEEYASYRERMRIGHVVCMS